MASDQGTLEPGVIKRGKIFEVGDYPDKNFSLTESEADAAISVFGPVPIDLEHTQTPLSGKLGIAQKIWRDGAALFGEVVIPHWLEKLIGDQPIKVSATWDRPTKTLKGLALTLNPSISDAAVFAAFSQAQSSEEEKPEKTLRKTSPMDKKPSLGERLKSLLAKADPEEAEALFSAGSIAFEPAPKASVEKPIDEAAARELEGVKAENATFSARLLESDRDAFIAKARADKKILPAEEEPLKALFNAVVLPSDLATFAKGEHAGFKALQALIDARSPHQLTQEQLKDGAVAFSEGRSKTDTGAGDGEDMSKVSDERLAALLLKHPVGKTQEKK